jgi:hypothetical protein
MEPADVLKVFFTIKILNFVKNVKKNVQIVKKKTTVFNVLLIIPRLASGLVLVLKANTKLERLVSLVQSFVRLVKGLHLLTVSVVMSFLN